MAVRRVIAFTCGLVAFAFHAPVQAQTHALRTQPSLVVGPAGSLVNVEVRVTATQQVSVFQFTVDYDNTVATFEGVTIGSDLQARGFGIFDMVQNSVPPASPGTNADFVVQVFGGATNWFTGTNLRAAVLTFRLRPGVCDVSPVTFQQVCARTQMVTYQLDTICTPALQMQNSAIAASCATDTQADPAVPARWDLEASPNPFNPTTRLRFAIPAGAGTVPVVLRVHDIAGRIVRTLLNDTRSPGFHDVVWNGTDDSGDAVATGIYFVRVDAGAWNATRKIVLVK
jgi:hypothetical protein